MRGLVARGETARCWTASPCGAKDYTCGVSKTFYLETFGCQMNAHDSEKVVGTLESEGYVQTQVEDEAGLILYNTCSIRDKAEQKVFHRLNEYKKLQGEGKRFAVIGCVAQQEGEKIFERAPYVSIVAGSASYRNLPGMLARLEAGESRITGLDDKKTTETFETPFVARTNEHRGYVTIIEGCDKFCAYCVVPYTRGNERSRTSISVIGEAKRMADAGYTEIQFLGQNVNSRPAAAEDVCGTAGRGGGDWRDSAGAVYDLASAGFYEGYCGGDRRDAYALRPCPSASAVRFDRDFEGDGQGVHARLVSRADQLDEGGEARYFDYVGHHCRLSGRDGSGSDGDGDAAR